MKLRYETGIATLIQFVVISLLNIATGANSVVTACRSDEGCVSDLLVSVIFYLMVVGWFGFIWILGYAAQERRSKRLAQLLIGAELLVMAVAYFNTQHYNDHISLITSWIDLFLAAWVIFLAFRLMRAKGGRVVTRQRSRPRKPTN
jgi:hypothetical protein